VALPNGFTFYETSFAIWKLGAIPNVVSPRPPRAESSASIDLSRPALLVADTSLALDGLPLHALDAQRIAVAIHRAAAHSGIAYWKAMTSGGSTECRGHCRSHRRRV
jgi:bile acid-coenzyme A ligase